MITGRRMHVFKNDKVARARRALAKTPPVRCGAGRHPPPSMPQGAGDGLPQHIRRAWHAQFELNMRGSREARHLLTRPQTYEMEKVYDNILLKI